jgi:hypothetical protein
MPHPMGSGLVFCTFSLFLHWKLGPFIEWGPINSSKSEISNLVFAYQFFGLNLFGAIGHDCHISIHINLIIVSEFV